MKKIVIILGLLIIFAPLTINAQVAVIVNKSVKVNKISKDQLYSIYALDDSKWPGGAKVVVLDQKSNSDVKTKFYKYLGKKYSKMKKIWLKKQLTGEGRAPKGYSSDEDILDKVADTDGAIGFISAKNVNKKVKVIATIN